MSGHQKSDKIDKSRVLFYIEKLSCAYVENQPVLEAKKLTIPKRKITVLLGPSGSGKSTLLETLGLMTQTVDNKSSSIQFFPNDIDEHNLADMWADNQEPERYHIRMQYYSFIFQSTNLMPNFSALENVGLTELIQNKPESEAYFNAIESLVKNLSVTSLSYDKKPFEFSGGERQRLAFARAINPEFTVLFGDEPTGNLDHFNSVKLMHFIREFITTQRENASAIIVSHNIPLTLDFADCIIVLSKRENGISTVDPHFIYNRDELKWEESREKQKEIQQEIELLLNSDTESFVRILMHLSDNSNDEDFFVSIKQKMVDHQLKITNIKDVADEDKKSFQRWLNEEFEARELLNESIKENIRQFAYGELKKADIKINDVIRTIQDLKFKTAVEGQRDKNKSRSNTIEQQELGSSRSPVGAILGFIPWLILSIAPLFSFIFQKTSLFFVYAAHKISKPVKKKLTITDDENSYNSNMLFSFKNIIPRIFYSVCVAWDWLNVKYTIIAKYKFKQSWIPFKTIPHDFKHLFYRNETKELLGRKNKHFWLIVVILFFTFLAIGFSSGSLDYLKEKMDDPFVRSINASVGNNRGAFRVIDIYNTDSLKNRFNYDTIVGYNRWTAYFKGDLPQSPHRGVEGRSIPFDDPLVDMIVDTEINRTKGNAFVDDRDIGIIVTRNFIDKLECSDEPAFIFRRNTDRRGNERFIPIPIRAIVDRLPGERIDFVSTQSFYNDISTMGDRFLFSDNKRLYANVVTDTIHAEALYAATEAFFTRYFNEEGLHEMSMLDVYPHRNTYQSVLIVQISFFDSDNISMDEIDDLYTAFYESDEMQHFMDEHKVKAHQFMQSYFQNLDNRAGRTFDYIAVNFNDLSQVDVFAEQFAEDSGIQIEMSKIEQMKNYNFVSKLTTIMSLILIGFSVLMINIFLSNILSTHLNKIKMNIGTFKAFGIDIKRIYMGMMYIFVLLPLFFALALAAILGYLGLIYFVINGLSPFEVEKHLYFDLMNSYTVISIIVLAIVNYYVFNRIIHRIFKQTPGDLIYDRNNKA